MPQLGGGIKVGSSRGPGGALRPAVFKPGDVKVRAIQKPIQAPLEKQ